MTERETTRFVAWSAELRRVHARLREALRVTREALAEGSAAPARELLLYCHGFCTALDGHHRGEDRSLFPAIRERHPRLAPVLRALEQDHSMIAHLLDGLRAAIDGREQPAALDRHLEGIAAVMESHFRYEERQLLAVLAELDLTADPEDVLGPL